MKPWLIRKIVGVEVFAGKECRRGVLKKKRERKWETFDRWDFHKKKKKKSIVRE